MFRLLSRIKQKGMAVLGITMTILAVITIITLFGGAIIITDNKIFQNQLNSAYAFNAAQAGVDYALGYLNASSANQSAIVTAASPALASCASASNTTCLAGGTVQACTSTGPTNTLATSAGNATYTVKYACVAAGNTTILGITSRGASPDGTSNRTINMTVYKYASGSNATPVISKTTVNIGSSALVRNLYSGATRTVSFGNPAAASVRITSGADTSFNVGAPYSCSATYSSLAGGGGTGGGGTTCTDIFYDSTLAGLSTSTFETNYIGRTITSFATLVPSPPITRLVMNCSGNKTFNGTTTLVSQCGTPTVNTTGSTTLSGITNALIYINMNGSSLTITQGANRSFVLGTLTTAPVILVVNNASVIRIQGTGNATTTINGNIYTNSQLILNRSGSSLVTVNGLVFSSNTTASYAVTVQNSADVNGMVVGRNVFINSSGTIINYDSTSAGYISGSLGGYVGANALSSGGGGGASYGIVSGSWRDF